MSVHVVEPRVIRVLLTGPFAPGMKSFLWHDYNGELYTVGAEPLTGLAFKPRHFTFDELGVEMLRVCRASVAARHGFEPLPGSHLSPEEFIYVPVVVPAIEVLRLADEYEYQSNIGETFMASPVAPYLDTVRRSAIRALPGYHRSEAPHLSTIGRMLRAAAGPRLYDEVSPLFADPDGEVNGGDLVDTIGSILRIEREKPAYGLGLSSDAIP